MAQDEREKFAAIKQLMVNSEFDEALKQLEAIGGPKAEQWIAEIKQRVPLKTSLPPLPVDDVTQAQRLISQRRFDEAEALLKASEHAYAAELLKKLAAERRDMAQQPTIAQRPSMLTMRINRLWAWVRARL
jgi:hypothetical protein